jgi:6-phosphogluconate dehydrogenase
MRIGMVGLGRMGADMVRRLLKGGHECVVYDVSPKAVELLGGEGAMPALSLTELTSKLKGPRVVWLMIPAAFVSSTLKELLPLLSNGDIIVDGGNSYYVDDLKHAQMAEDFGIGWVDVGTSGGVHGLERGYCLMIGGQAQHVEFLDPVFATLAPGDPDGVLNASGEASAESTAALGYLHCGPVGAGHFVKMVHNGIEYGLMAAYAEGFNILRHANIGRMKTSMDAETSPLQFPEHYQYDLPLPEIAEVWKRGSVISSWLLDLTAAALKASPELQEFDGRVSDSGEGRWTLLAAIDEGVPAEVLSAALFARFASRSNAAYANKLMSAMRFQFGGHNEKHEAQS